MENKNLRITNPFGTPHVKTGFHQGTDFITDDLIVIFPYYRGRVMAINFEPTGAGNYIVIRFIDTNNKTHYIELDHFEEFYVKPNDLLLQGTKIGKMGATGFAEGIHTHAMRFEPVDNGADWTIVSNENISGGE